MLLLLLCCWCWRRRYVVYEAEKLGMFCCVESKQNFSRGGQEPGGTEVNYIYLRGRASLGGKCPLPPPLKCSIRIYIIKSVLWYSPCINNSPILATLSGFSLCIVYYHIAQGGKWADFKNSRVTFSWALLINRHRRLFV